MPPQKKVKTATPKTKAVQKEVATPVYLVSFIFPDHEERFETNTIFNALEQVSAPFIKGAVVIKVKKGELQSEFLMYPLQFRKMMANKVLKQIIEKRLNTALH